MKRLNILSRNYFFYNRWVFIILLLLLSLASFWRGLFFDFYQDDHFFLWNGFYNPFVQFINFKHPGTPLESFVLAHIFGLNQVLWQIFGIVLKIISAYLVGIFLYSVTNSKIAGFLAAVFFAVSYAGMYAINAFNYHLPAIIAIFILLSLIYLVKSIRESKQDIWKFVIFLIISILLDPARALPIFFLLPFFLFLFPKSKNRLFVKKFLIKFYLIILIIIIPLFVLWYFTFSIGEGSQLEILLRDTFTNPRYMILKTKYMGTFFATVANLYTELLYGLKPSLPLFETAYYSRIFGLAGAFIFFMGILSFIHFLRNKSRFFLIISFFIIWAYFFYLPNWISEPRVAMTSIKHYLFISSIGYVCLTAYLFSLIKKKWLIFLLSICFIALNIYRANNILTLLFPYRSAQLIEGAWETISRTVPRSEANYIFLFSGDTAWFNNSIFPGGAFHFLSLRKIANASYLPHFTYDKNFTVSRLCSSIKITIIDDKIISYPQVPLSHIFAWEVKFPPGLLEDRTQQVRKKLELEAQQKKCNILK